MPRRRAERQQEKEEFLQQNPELIRVETRIEVVTTEGEDGEDTDIDVEISQEGFPPETLDLDDPLEFENGFLVDDLSLFPFAIIAGDGLNLSNLDDEPDQALLSITESGFGVASRDELNIDPDADGEDLSVDIVESDEDDELPDGAGTISDDEGLFILSFAASSLGIDFMVTGRGSVQLTAGLIGEDDQGEEELVTEVFQTPRGAEPGDVFRLEVEDPSAFIFGAALTTTGTAEVSILGIDIEVPGTFFLA